MITVKIEAVGGIKRIHPTLWKIIGFLASKLELRDGLHIRITSTDGDNHMPGSFHYLGRAVDFALFVTEGQKPGNKIEEVRGYIELMAKYRNYIKKEDIDIIYYDKTNHYHIEFDPKGV